MHPPSVDLALFHLLSMTDRVGLDKKQFVSCYLLLVSTATVTPSASVRDDVSDSYQRLGVGYSSRTQLLIEFWFCFVFLLMVYGLSYDNLVCAIVSRLLLY